jgi:predicted PhzF superfamily epimerase YddE/YHI9
MAAPRERRPIPCLAGTIQAMRAQQPGLRKNNDRMVQVQHWRVFPRGAAGGNPCPLVTDARELTAGQMRAIAAHYGHESGFVTSLSGSTVRLRYFVPRQEMRMCVHAARPDFPALWTLCSRLETTGAYAFAPHPDGDPSHLVARQYPVDAGYPEDPATGVAAAALAAYLASQRRPARPAWTRITIDQGDAMHAPSRLHAAALAGPDAVTQPSVTGQAIRTGQAEFNLSTLPAGLPEPELR